MDRPHILAEQKVRKEDAKMQSEMDRIIKENNLDHKKDIVALGSKIRKIGRLAKKRRKYICVAIS